MRYIKLKVAKLERIVYKDAQIQTMDVEKLSKQGITYLYAREGKVCRTTAE